MQAAAQATGVVVIDGATTWSLLNTIQRIMRRKDSAVTAPTPSRCAAAGQGPLPLKTARKLPRYQQKNFSALVAYASLSDQGLDGVHSTQISYHYSVASASFVALPQDQQHVKQSAATCANPFHPAARHTASESFRADSEQRYQKRATRQQLQPTSHRHLYAGHLRAFPRLRCLRTIDDEQSCVDYQEAPKETATRRARTSWKTHD